MAKELELLGMRIENIRGFSNSYLPFDKGLEIFVGANNAGKTSLFKILNWIFSLNIERIKKGSDSMLTENDLRTLRPARNVRNKASRVSILLRVKDGRKRRGLEPDERDISTLRFNYRLGKKLFSSPQGSHRGVKDLFIQKKGLDY